MLNKEQIIEQIQAINPTAGHDWLDDFGPEALEVYLEHLQKTLEPRGGDSIWQRRGDTKAVVTRRPAA